MSRAHAAVLYKLGDPTPPPSPAWPPVPSSYGERCTEGKVAPVSTWFGNIRSGQCLQVGEPGLVLSCQPSCCSPSKQELPSRAFSPTVCVAGGIMHLLKRFACNIETCTQLLKATRKGQIYKSLEAVFSGSTTYITFRDCNQHWGRLQTPGAPCCRACT